MNHTQQPFLIAQSIRDSKMEGQNGMPIDRLENSVDQKK